MRVIALLSLLFGFMGELLLDGQTFTHAVLGIIFGAAAIGCGLGSARKDRTNATCRLEGRIMAALGLALVVFCVIQLPSAYRFQTKFNARIKNYQKLHETSARPASELVEAGKDVAWSDGYVLHVAKRDGSSLEGIHVVHKNFNGQVTTIIADKGTLQPGSTTIAKNGVVTTTNAVTIILLEAQFQSTTMNQPQVIKELTLVLHQGL